MSKRRRPAAKDAITGPEPEAKKQCTPPASAPLKYLIHYQDKNTLVIRLFIMNHPIDQVFQRRTKNLWTATYPEDGPVMWGCTEVLILDPEPVLIGRFNTYSNRRSLYAPYRKAHEDMMRGEAPVKGGLTAEKLHNLYPGELGALTRCVLKCHSAEEWCTSQKCDSWEGLVKHHFEY